MKLSKVMSSVCEAAMEKIHIVSLATVCGFLWPCYGPGSGAAFRGIKLNLMQTLGMYVITQMTCRSAAAVEVVTRELKMRTTSISMPRPAEAVGGPRGAKRKRTAAPEETCPYCNHVYTVRDGLSTKTDMEGNRWVAGGV